jgi:hypothetical protein
MLYVPTLVPVSFATTLAFIQRSLPSQRTLLLFGVALFAVAFSIDLWAAPPASTYDFTASQTTLPPTLTTMITNATTILKLGAGAAIGLAILRGGMFFVVGLARSILAAAG